MRTRPNLSYGRGWITAALLFSFTILAQSQGLAQQDLVLLRSGNIDENLASIYQTLAKKKALKTKLITLDPNKSLESNLKEYGIFFNSFPTSAEDLLLELNKDNSGVKVDPKKPLGSRLVWSGQSELIVPDLQNEVFPYTTGITLKDEKLEDYVRRRNFMRFYDSKLGGEISLANNPERLAKIAQLNPHVSIDTLPDLAQVKDKTVILPAEGMKLRVPAGSLKVPAARGAKPSPRPSKNVELVVAARLEPRELRWNVWAEEWAESARPVNLLAVSTQPDSLPYRFVADLSFFSYQPEDRAVKVLPAQKLSEWLTSAQQPILEAIVLPDESFFEIVSDRVQSVPIKIEKLRSLRDGKISAPHGNVFDLMRASSNPKELDFRFATLEFSMRPKKPGWGRLSIVFFANGRYVDELNTAFCIGSQDNCGVRPNVQSPLTGVDSLRIGSETNASIPDAALYFLEFSLFPGTPPKIMGVFTINEKLTTCVGASRHIVWPIDNRDDLKDAIESILNAFQNTEDAKSLNEYGDALATILFPTGVQAAQDAQNALQCFVKAKSAAFSPQNKVASLFVRLVLRDDSTPPIIPIGLLTINVDGKPRFLGDVLRLEMPLKNQSYERVNTCQQTWAAAIAPELNGEADLVVALKTARKAMQKEVIGRWESEYKYTGLVGDTDMSGLRSWFKPAKSDDKKPVALFVLSHHDQDSLFYDSSARLTTTMIKREFAKPSFVVLNACRTVGTSKNAFVSKLDARGVDAVIASLTNANAAMAGVFYRCFDAELKDRAADDSPTLAEVFANTIQCVKGHKKINRFIGDNEDDDPIDYYGANAYKYTLLGNGNIRVCLDKGAKP